MTAAEQARHDAATHAARRQTELDRIAAMTPEQREAEQAAFRARIAELSAEPDDDESDDARSTRHYPSLEGEAA